MSFKIINIKNFKSDLDKSSLPLMVFSEDDFLREFFLDKALSKLEISRDNCDFFFGGELKKENLLSLGGTPSLFQEVNERVTIVLNAENLSKEISQILKEDFPKLLILTFSKKSALFKDLWNNQDELLTSFEVVPPRFWEYSDYLDQLLNIFNVQLDLSGRSYFMQIVKQGTYDYFNGVTNISHFFGEKILTKQDLESVLPSTFFDTFVALDYFLQRKFKLFFGLITGFKDISMEDIRHLAVFMQGQLIKMNSFKSGNLKKKLNSFENKILKFSELWSAKDIEKSISFFASMEKDAKMKEDNLLAILRAKTF